MRSLLLFIVFCMLSVAGYAENGQQQFEKATQSYTNGQYADAVKQYEELETAGYRSAELYYNLGNSYYKQEEYGRAVLNYERALLLNPQDADIRHNIEEVQHRLKDEIEELPAFFLAEWWRGLRQSATTSVWSGLSILLMWLSFGGFMLWLRGKERQQRKYGFLAGLTLLLLSILTFALAYDQTAMSEDSGQAIIMEQKIQLRAAPDEDSKSVLTLHEGTKVDILDQIGEWYKINLANGDQGWLLFEALEKI